MTLEHVIKLVKQVGGIEQTPYDYGAKSDGVILKHESLLALVKILVDIEREACAVTAWSYFMSECKRKRIPPSEFESWLAAGAIRSRNN